MTECDEAAVGTQRGIAATVIVLAGMGGLIALSLWARFTGPDPERLLALDVAVGVLAWAASPLVLRRPAATTLGLVALTVLSPAATAPASFGVLRTARSRRLPVAAAVAGIGVAAQAVQGAWRTGNGLSLPVWLGFIGIGYAALLGWGTLARTRAALVASLRERARRAEAEQAYRVTQARLAERRRIAREMHDVLAHRMSLLATYAGAVEYRPDAPPEQLTRAAGVVRDCAHQALEELREVIGLLREDDPDEAAGRAAGRPQPTLADLPRLVEETRDAGTRVDLRDDLAGEAAPDGAAGRAGYRVVQEALTNARRHAPGQPVTVLLGGRPGERLTIEVTNPLPAAPPLGTGAGSGTGLVGLGERVRLAGGQVEHGTVDGRFRVDAWLPWPR